MEENDICTLVLGAAIKVHTNLGPGLLESSYKECLLYELSKSHLFVEREKPVPLIYKEIKLNCGYRLDILMEKKLVVEIKSVEAINEVYLSQVLTYLKLGDYKLGLLLNFNVVKMKDGIRRIANGVKNGDFSAPSAPPPRPPR